MWKQEVTVDLENDNVISIEIENLSFKTCLDILWTSTPEKSDNNYVSFLMFVWENILTFAEAAEFALAADFKGARLLIEAEETTIKYVFYKFHT